MPGANNLKRVAEAVKESARESLREARNRHEQDVYASGFNEAASVCLSVLSENIEGLLAKIESGSYLSDQEQLLFSRLSKLKTEVEMRLENSRVPESADSERL